MLRNPFIHLVCHFATSFEDEYEAQRQSFWNDTIKKAVTDVMNSITESDFQSYYEE